MSVASMGFICRGDLESCMGECFVSQDRSGGPFGMEPSEMAHLLGVDCASETPLRVHTSGPGNAQTWIDSAYPDCVPEEVV